MPEYLIGAEPNCDFLRLGTVNVCLFCYNFFLLNGIRTFPTVEVWRALGAASLYVAEMNRSYTRPSYRLAKEVFGGNFLGDFALTSSCCAGGAFEKKLFAAVRGIIK